MKSSIPFTCLFLFQFLSFPFTAKTQCTWNGTAGNWSDGSKWSCGHAPLPAENVVINAGTVTLDVSPTVASFTMSNGTITGAYDLNVNNDLILSAGVLGNTGNVAVSGTCSWSGGTLGSTDGTATGTITITGAATLSTGTLKRLFGKTLQLNSGASYSGIGALSLGYGGVLNVPAGQVFSADVTGNVSWTAFTGGGTWNNAGTFDKQGNGALSIGFVFNNSAAVQVNSGALDLSNGGAHNGSFSIAPAATLEFGGGTHDLSTSTLSSTGSLIVSGGTATMPNNSTHTDVTLSGGTAHFSGNNSMDDLMVSGGTLNLSGSLVVQSLTMTNGTVAGACPIAIAGNLSLSAGVLGNTGNVAVLGTCSWSGGTLGSTDGTATGTITITGAATLSTGTLKRLFGKTLQLSSGASYSGIGVLSLGYGGVLNVPAGQVFSADVTGNVSWTAFTGGGTWNNAGTFDKQGNGALSIGFVFNNSAAVQVNSGALDLSNGGAHNGSFSIAPAATLEFGGGTHDLSTSTLSSTGSLIVSGGTATMPNNSTHTDVTLSGGTAHLSGNNSMDDLMVSGGTLNLSGSLVVQSLTMTNGTVAGACSITIAGNLSLSAGVLGNTGNVAVSGTCSWAGGTLGSTDGMATGTITVAGAATFTSGSLKRLFTKTLNLNGGAAYSGNGALQLGYGGTVNIPSGQTCTANVTAIVFWTAGIGGGAWNNAGTFDKQGSSALSIGFVFNNSAAVQVNSGALDLSNGGAHNGSFSMAPAATLEFGGGTHNLSTSTLSSTGSLIVSGGTATFPNNSAHTDVTVSGGTANFSGNNTMEDLLASGGTLNFSGSLAAQTLTMTNGTMAGNCPVSIAGQLSLSAGVLGNTGNMTVSGAFSWSGGTLGSADGSATGTITVAGAATITSTSLKRLFTKTLNLNGGAAYSGNGTWQLGYGGTVNIPSGQTCTANVTAIVSWTAGTGGGIWNNAGTFDKQGSGTLSIGFTFDNSGAITGTGTLTFSSTFNNSGLISPGASPGILNLNKTSPGLTVQNLAIELEGPTPGVGGYDQLNNTSGALNLNGGILSVTLLNGYLPDVGTSFVIATGTSRTGTFGTLQLPVDNTRWTVTYNATNVTLTVASSLPVQLVDFQVKREGVVALLNWYAATERNNRGFCIERSIDGHNFENIAFVASRGDTDTPVSYTFEDATLPSAPNVYYRLRQEDNDGAISYSIIRKVTGSVSFSATLSPNPAVDVVTILADLPRKSTVNVSITDLQGRPVYQAPGNLLEAGLQQLQVQVNDIPTGVYLFHLQTDTSIQSVPMIKQ